MPDASTPADTLRWAFLAATAADEKKAEDTLVLTVEPVLGLVDHFVITSASNDRQVKTIAEEVEARVKAAGGPPPLRVEGTPETGWVLLDLGDVVVHVFRDDVRRFYDLERLYADVPVVDWRTAVAVEAG